MKPYQILQNWGKYFPVHPCFKSMAVTATRLGLTADQIITFTDLLFKLEPKGFYHGAAIGGDYQLFQMVQILHNSHLDCFIRAYPSNIADQRVKRAVEDSDEAHPPNAPLARNRAMVNDGDYLVAFPATPLVEYRGGTWSTIHYAFDRKKPVLIVLPNGEIIINLDQLKV